MHREPARRSRQTVGRRVTAPGPKQCSASVVSGFVVGVTVVQASRRGQQCRGGWWLQRSASGADAETAPSASGSSDPDSEAGAAGYEDFSKCTPLKISVVPRNQPLEQTDSGASEARRIPAVGWQEVSGSAVFFPRSAPRRSVHFLGGAFVGASPRLFYETFLEYLAEEAEAVVVATPFKLTFDYDATASGTVSSFDEALSAMANKYSDSNLAALPMLGVGHSCGALLHSLLAASERPYEACVLMSFNNKPVSDAIPVPLPPAPEDSRLRQLLRNSAEAILADGPVEDSLQAVRTAAEFAVGALQIAAAPQAGGASLAPDDAERLARQAAPVVSQLGPLLGSLASGERDFSLSREAVSERLRARYAAPRTLLVQFANDLTDESRRLQGVLEEKDLVEFLRFPGGHAAPLDLSGDDKSRLRRLTRSIGAFVCEEGTIQPEADKASQDLSRLKERLLRLTAGTNRGFTTLFPTIRSEIMSCVEEIEALSPSAFKRSEGPQLSVKGELVPKQLLGKWRLIWATSPDVLLLSSLPLVDCGEIRQDIAAPESDTAVLEVINSVELSPKGIGLLGIALPQLVRAATVLTKVKAVGEPGSDGTLAIRFEQGTVEPSIPGLPALPLPLPSVALTSSGNGSSIKLLTSFLDGEMRVARSPVGDVFVLARAA